MKMFVVDYNPAIAAQNLHDKHLFQLPYTVAQMLLSPFSLGDEITVDADSWATWAKESKLNYYWMLMFGTALCMEFKFRHNVDHEVLDLVKWCGTNSWKLKFPKNEMTPFVVEVPERYAIDDPVESYRRYYRAEELTVTTEGYVNQWTNRDIPTWASPDDQVYLH